jgi:hypothetical protein
MIFPHFSFVDPNYRTFSLRAARKVVGEQDVKPVTTALFVAESTHIDEAAPMTAPLMFATPVRQPLYLKLEIRSWRAPPRYRG